MYDIFQEWLHKKNPGKAGIISVSTIKAFFAAPRREER
jgi:hypothetical protein